MIGVESPSRIIRQGPHLIIPQRTLIFAVGALQTDPNSPVALTEFNQAFWNASRNAMSLNSSDLVVSPSPYAESEIAQHRIEGDLPLYLPQVVSTAPDGLVLLGKAFAELNSGHFRQGTAVLNVDTGG